MPSKDWTEVSDDEILNSDNTQPFLIERYNRILQQRTIIALMNVRGGLDDVKKATHILAGKLDDRLAEVDKNLKATATSQSRLQGATLFLTLVIAAATITYTWITWESVQAQREANQIQREMQANKKP